VIEHRHIGKFALSSIVVHYVPTEKDDPGDELIVTDSAIDLDNPLTKYFQSKITERLTEKGLEVVSSSEYDSPVPEAVLVIQADSGALVSESQRIATHLDSVQAPKVNSSGLLAVATGQVRGAECVAIVKLERERGVRFAIRTVDGRNTVDLELLRNLTLTDKTKVYKTALLARSGDGIGGFVADDQLGALTGRQVATFFLSGFLGCKPKIPAAEVTFAFVKVANESFNADVDSPELKGRYQVALLAAMQSNATTLRPDTFAKQNLEHPHRAPFLARVAAAGIDANVAFPKDTSRVKVSRFRMTFESGMVLVGDREALDERVELPKEQNSGEPVIVKDAVANLLSGR
jgi:hypothetical protein